MNTPHTLIIGVDGATFDLIEPFVRAGRLPALARLMAQGVHGPLRSWPNMNSASAWSSMVTGYNPGQHGVYDFGIAPPQRGYYWRPTTAADRRRDPFWRLLSVTGQRMGIINVPISYPADLVNGFMLAGMDAPGVHSPGFAHPPDLYNELYRQGIHYSIDVPNLGVRSKRGRHQLPPSVKQMVDVRSHTVLYLMKTHPWDVVMAVFVATDRVQHFFWPNEDPSVDDPNWAPIRDIYQKIDSFLNDALALVDANTTVLVVSDHGFGPIRYAMHCLNLLFSQVGLLRFCLSGSQLKGQFLKYLLHYGRKIIPFSLQDPLARLFPQLHLHTISEYMFPGIEWSQTQVFTNLSGVEVFINLRGKTPEGTVSAEDYHPLREQVRDILLNLTDPNTGYRVVRAVHRREDIYHGPYMEQAADLLIEWDYEVVRDSLCYSIGRNHFIVQPPKRLGIYKRWTATHRPQGIFIAYGPQIKQGMKVEKAHLYDIAPTILYLQGHPIPRDIDGGVLTHIFTDEHLHQHPVKYAEPSISMEQRPTPELDWEEEKKIEERLRNLGYIE